MIFQCNRCLKYFSTKYHYNNHLGRKIQCKENINKNVHNDDKDKNEYTETTTPSSQNVVDRLPQRSILTTSSKLDIDFTNSKENGFKCRICGIIYKFSQSLSSHKRNKHPNYESEIKELNKDTSEVELLKKIFIKESLDHKQKIEKLIKDLEEEKNKRVEIIGKTSKTKTINKTTNNINNTTKNINNGTINNITMVGFGERINNNKNNDLIYVI
jgi:hypothetical protein